MARFLDLLNEDSVAILDHFVSPEALSLIVRELEFTYWAPSSVVKYVGDEESPAYFSEMRQSHTSGQFWFSNELNECLTEIELKLAEVLETSTKHFEEWQATRYGPQDRFDYHVDCGNWQHSPAGERKRSILLYLETPIQGGQTHFRALNRTVEPLPGRVVVWNNLLANGNCNFAMIHASLPVLEGKKTILVSWERERQLRP